MKMLLSFLTSLGICAVTALPSYSTSVSESSAPIENYYSTRNLVTSSWNNSKIQAFKQQIKKEACALGETQTLLNNGVTLRYRFWTPDGQLLNTWLLTPSAVTCHSTESLPIEIMNPSSETSKHSPIAQPKQPIGNLQLGLMAIVLGIIVAAIAKSRQSTLTTQKKSRICHQPVKKPSNNITAFSSEADSVEMFNFCSSNRSQIHRKMGELVAEKESQDNYSDVADYCVERLTTETAFNKVSDIKIARQKIESTK